VIYWLLATRRRRISIVSLLLLAIFLQYNGRDTPRHSALRRIEQLGGYAPHERWSPPIIPASWLSALPAAANMLPKGTILGFVVEGKPATDEDLGLFCRAFPHAEQVKLGSTQITDDGLAHIATLRSLFLLSLMNTDVGDAGVEHLTGLSRLQIVELDNTAVTDDALADLASVPSLYRLSLAGTTITDTGLKHLHALPRLGAIDVTDTNVTDAGILALKQRFPQCQVYR
jgi:hypothetical protein